MNSKKLEKVEKEKAISPATFFDLSIDQQMQLSVKIAKTLNDYVSKSGIRPLVIGQNKHLYNQHWQFIGIQFKCVVKTRFEQIEGGAKGIAEVVYLPTGEVIGGAEAVCLALEKNWQNKDFYAIASMAQTRAASRALKNVFGWIVSLSGYQATPAEEMENITFTAKQTVVQEIPQVNGVLSEEDIRIRLHAQVGEYAKEAGLNDQGIANVIYSITKQSDTQNLTIEQLQKVVAQFKKIAEINRKK